MIESPPSQEFFKFRYDTALGSQEVLVATRKRRSASCCISLHIGSHHAAHLTRSDACRALLTQYDLALAVADEPNVRPRMRSLHALMLCVYQGSMRPMVTMTLTIMQAIYITAETNIPGEDIQPMSQCSLRCWMEARRS